MAGVRGIPLEVFIPSFVAKKANQDMTLLIFDQVGKQVKWLQYYLEEYGYENYHFLEGGATAVPRVRNTGVEVIRASTHSEG